MNVSQFFDRLLWGLLVAVAAYCSSQIQSVTMSINRLNENMAIVLTTMTNQKESILDHEKRIRALEIKK